MKIFGILLITLTALSFSGCFWSGPTPIRTVTVYVPQKCEFEPIVLVPFKGMNGVEKISELVRRNYDYKITLESCR